MITAFVLVGWFVCLFGNNRELAKTPWLGGILSEAGAVLSDPALQWMVFACVAAYLVCFCLLRGRTLPGGAPTAAAPSLLRGTSGANACLLALAALSAAHYALAYEQAARSTDALVLLGAATLGSGAAWLQETPSGRFRHLRRETLFILIGLLLIAAVWHSDAGLAFRYGSDSRWTGPWENPNTFGMLMGVGFTLAMAAAFGSRSLPHPKGSPARGALKRLLVPWVMFAAAAVMGIGLVNSYSRGAWVGTALALSYIGVERLWGRIRQATGNGNWKDSLRAPRTGRLPHAFAVVTAPGNWGSAAIILLALGALVFWHCHDSPSLPARRAVSIANLNDFSWRNRIAAWKGALQMMADKPWLGYGWNQPEIVYAAFYQPAKLSEGMAIQLNDYLTLGASLGIPALVCFLAYTGRSFAGTRQRRARAPTSSAASEPTDWLPLACRAGAAVLLAGFWFDGGLFRLSTGATFWVLLELGWSAGPLSGLCPQRQVDAPGNLR